MKTRTRCVVCGKEYFASNTKGGSRIKATRQKRAVTCSKKCSRCYQSVVCYLNNNGRLK